MTRGVKILLMGLLLAIGSGWVAFAADLPSVRVAEGPICLRDNVAFEWGGHTFSYMLVGESYVFWAAKASDADSVSSTVYVGQYPKTGVDAAPHVTSIKLVEPIKRIYQPQLLRSPDGYLHVFTGYVAATDSATYQPGTMKYYRSEQPDDITSLVDRSELLPKGDFGNYHLRMNVGVSRDGKRAALVVLAISPDGSVPFNTPVVLRGERQGLDYVFQPPVQYAEAMALFYPLVAVVDSGFVVIGEVWENPPSGVPQRNAVARLLHIGWDGQLLHREDLPLAEDGRYCVYDLRPLNEDWTELALWYTKVPVSETNCRHELWEYNCITHETNMVRGLDVTLQYTNPGKYLPLAEGQAVFLNNPMQWRLRAWIGDFAGGGSLEEVELPQTDPRTYGFDATYYLAIPSPLVGSVCDYTDLYVMTDCPRVDRAAGNPDPCALLLYRLEVELDKAEGES